MRALPALLLALAAAAPGPAAAGPRLAIEGGLAWFASLPDEATAPAGAVRLRQPIGPRLLVGAGFVHVDRTLVSGVRGIDLVPLTLSLALDRAPLAPRFGAGVSLIRIEGVPLDWGPVGELGLDWHLDERFALGAQLTWTGHRRATFFPWDSALTAGLSAALF